MQASGTPYAPVNNVARGTSTTTSRSYKAERLCCPDKTDGMSRPRKEECHVNARRAQVPACPLHEMTRTVTLASRCQAALPPSWHRGASWLERCGPLQKFAPSAPMVMVSLGSDPRPSVPDRPLFHRLSSPGVARYSPGSKFFRPLARLSRCGGSPSPRELALHFCLFAHMS
jgi:hypothetical protein